MFRTSTIIESIIYFILRDCIPPILLAVIMYMTGMKEFWETAAFLCMSQITCSFIIEYFEFGKLKYRLARQFVAPIITPGIVLSLFAQLDRLEMAEMSYTKMGDAWLQYWVFLFYRVGMALGEPVLDLMIFGPTDRGLRKIITERVHEIALRITGSKDPEPPAVYKAPDSQQYQQAPQQQQPYYPQQGTPQGYPQPPAQPYPPQQQPPPPPLPPQQAPKQFPFAQPPSQKPPTAPPPAG